MSYTKENLIMKLEESKTKMHLFYKQPFINYRGETSDTEEYFSEIICEWLLNNISLLAKIPMITRENSYRINSHNGIIKDLNSSREEEIIAMKMYNKKYDFIGKIIDYQTPLKNKSSDEAGKIDLLSYDGKTVRVLELKKLDSKETMLRCVLEGYTYLQTVDEKKLLANFMLPSDTLIKACPFVFRYSEQYNEMQEERPHLKQLMDLLDCKPYYISETNGKYFVMEN